MDCSLLCHANNQPSIPPLLPLIQTLLLGLARTPFSEADPMHLTLLRSLLATFTGRGTASGGAARYGSHWADIGFQGQDPATDLRG